VRLRRYLEKLRGIGELLEIREEVSPELEIASISMLTKTDKPLLFTKVDGKDIPVVTNLVNRKRIMDEMKVSDDEELYAKLLEACEKPLKGELVDINEASFAYREEKADLSKLPVLKHFEKDPGPYVTSSIVIAKQIDGKIHNASVHRILVKGRDKGTIRIVPRHLWKLYKEALNKGKELPVVVLVGVHPLVILAAASSPPFGVYEMYVANRLMKGEMKFVTMPESNIIVPSEAEIVLEGYITAEEEDEGPFVDILGIYDKRRKQPVIRFERMWLSERAVYHAIIPGGDEHKVLMGLHREASIWDAVRRVVPRVWKVRLTSGGGGWLHAVISISKSCEGDGKNAIMAAFAAHPSLKHVVVVDDDIDVDRLEEVEWSIATRLQASRGLVVIRGARGSSLDPSADQENLITDKIGVDATRSLFKPREAYQRVKPYVNKRIMELLKKLEGY